MGSDKNRPKLNKTLRTWMISYILMFSLPFLVGAFLTFRAYHQHTAKEIRSLQYQALAMVQTAVEHMLQDALNTSQALSLDSRTSILELFQENGRLSSRQTLMAKELQDILSLHISTNKNFQTIFLYFPKTGYLLTRDRFHKLEAFQSVESSMFGMPSEDFLLLANYTKNGLHIINGRLLYTYALSLNGGATPSVLTAVYFNEAILTELFQSSDTLLFLEDGYGKLYSPDADTKPQLSAWFEELLEGWDENGRKTSAKKAAIRISSKQYPIHFYSIRSSSSFQTGILFFAGLGIYLLFGSLIGILLALWLSKRNYQPVAELLSLVAQNSKQAIPPGHDDFYIIRSSYQALLSAYQDNRRTLREWQADKTNSWMNRLFKEKTKSSKSIFLENTSWAEAMTLDSFVLMSIEITDFCGTEQSDELTVLSQEDGAEISSDIVDMAYFIVKNCLDELLNKQYTSFSSETDGRLYALINVSQEEAVQELQQNLMRAASDLQDFIRTHYGLLLSIHISARRKGAEQIADCYQDIEELFLYRNYVNSEEETTLSRLQTDTDPKKQDIQAAAVSFSNQLYSTLIHGGKEKLEQLLTTVWQHYTGSGLDTLPDSPVSSAAGTDSDRMEAVIEQISDYIQEHYQEPLLSVGVIADEFHLGLSFLSRNYKEQKGVGILESINRLRLEKAKELIFSGVSIKDTASAVGFYSTQPLIRIFKQIEHMTPSEYRNQHRGDV